ncbi:MAG TPA: ATP-binding protein [Pilimelia sp.]|nr:ATP-binding protein [Pilimelia sp.]
MSYRPPSDTLSPGHRMEDVTPGLRCVAENLELHTLVRLIGVLDADGIPAVRSCLVGCLVEQPAALVVDLTDLRTPDPDALSVFAATAADTAEWPAVALCLVDPGRRVAEGRSADAEGGTVRVFAALQDALRGLGPPEATDPRVARAHLRAELLPVVGAARQARELVTEACGRWELPHLLGPACTVVTELVNNVVVHARTPMTVRLHLDRDHLHVTVRDASPQAPRARGPVAPTAPGGRGLVMIQAVAARWGFLPLADGKVVWALLARDQEGSF